MPEGDQNQPHSDDHGGKGKGKFKGKEEKGKQGERAESGDHDNRRRPDADMTQLVQTALASAPVDPTMVQLGLLDRVKNKLSQLLQGGEVASSFVLETREVLASLTEQQCKSLTLDDLIGAGMSNDLGYSMGSWVEIAATGNRPTSRTLASSRIQTRFHVPVPLSVYDTFSRDSVVLFAYLNESAHETFRLPTLQYMLSAAALRTSIGEGNLASLQEGGYLCGDHNNSFIKLNTSHSSGLQSYFLPGHMAVPSRQSLRDNLYVSSIGGKISDEEELHLVVSPISILTAAGKDEICREIFRLKGRLDAMVGSVTIAVQRKFFLRALFRLAAPLFDSVSPVAENYFDISKRPIYLSGSVDGVGEVEVKKLKITRRN